MKRLLKDIQKFIDNMVFLSCDPDQQNAPVVTGDWKVYGILQVVGQQGLSLGNRNV